MKVDRIIYSQVLPTGSYLNHKPGLEASLEEGEDPVEALLKLKEITDRFHKMAYPDLDGLDKKEIVVIPQVKEERPPQSMIEQINSCKDVVVLSSYKFIVRGKPDLQAVYDEKMKKLQKAVV